MYTVTESGRRHDVTTSPHADGPAPSVKMNVKNFNLKKIFSKILKITTPSQVRRHFSVDIRIAIFYLRAVCYWFSG